MWRGRGPETNFLQCRRIEESAQIDLPLVTIRQYSLRHPLWIFRNRDSEGPKNRGVVSNRPDLVGRHLLEQSEPRPGALQCRPPQSVCYSKRLAFRTNGPSKGISQKLLFELQSPEGELGINTWASNAAAFSRVSVTTLQSRIPSLLVPLLTAVARTYES